MIYKVYYEVDENGVYHEGTIEAHAESTASAEEQAAQQLHEQHPDGVIITCMVVDSHKASPR